MREIININNGWKFTTDAVKGECPSSPGFRWNRVTLPHTWNNLDGQDGGMDFYRGKCWYMTAVELDIKQNEEAYLEIPGAEAVAEVFVNDRKICTHKGGFSTFRCNLTPYLKNGKAKIAVSVDNSESKEIYPQTADFTFYGGLYRGANIIIVNEKHFDLDYYGAPGVSVTPVVNEDGSATVSVSAYITNADADTTVVFETDGQSAASDAKNTSCEFRIENPHLWNGTQDPYLYTLTAKLLDGGYTVDEIKIRYGIRTFSVDPEKGFFLNGKSYPLRGVSRHQDRENMGWAITEKEHKEDMELISEVGANTIRLAHYQHSQTFYDLCDEYGMVVWAEIPFISAFMPGEAARENTISQMKELIYQNYNHPSIVCWGVANEITIGGEDPELVENIRILNDLCHELDKTRLTTIANLTMVENDSVFNKITDIVSYNHYFGWYIGDVADNGPWLDAFHKENPDVCLGLSEYGCEGILKYHNDNPQIQDYSEEYQAYYHEKMLETFESRPFLWSTHVWNMFDFGSDMRDEGGVKGRNNKGLVTFDRKIKKDSFYLYKAYWTTDDFVHICSSRYYDRTTDRINVKVYSNAPEVTLEADGVKFATLKGDKIFVFENVPLKYGVNTIKAFTEASQDFAQFNRTDTANESYVLKSENTGNNASNWFEGIAQEGDITVNDGYFSIYDKIGDIMKTADGEAFINAMIEKITSEMNMNVSSGMLNMAKGFTVQKVFDMAGSRLPAGVKVWVNNELQKIAK